MKTRLNQRKIVILFAGILVSTCFALGGSSTVSGQGLDDLFSRPSDAVFLDRDEDAPPSRPVNPARSAPNRGITSPSDLRLVDSPGSIERRMPSAMELRQQRALAESRARIARLEAGYWGFRPTLRPTWSADLTTTSYYSSGHTVYVPVYVLPR